MPRIVVVDIVRRVDVFGCSSALRCRTYDWHRLRTCRIQILGLAAVVLVAIESPAGAVVGRRVAGFQNRAVRCHDDGVAGL